MKETLSEYQVAHRLYQDKNAGWSIAGARALAAHMGSVEADTGEEMELDVVAIRCEFSEYPSAIEAANEFGFEPPDEEDDDEETALDWLQDRTVVIEFGCGIIIHQF